MRSSRMTVRDRQEQLEADVRRTWGAGRVEFEGTPEVHGENERAN